jgi:hypothetical protein
MAGESEFETKCRDCLILKTTDYESEPCVVRADVPVIGEEPQIWLAICRIVRTNLLSSSEDIFIPK